MCGTLVLWWQHALRQAFCRDDGVRYSVLLDASRWCRAPAFASKVLRFQY